MTLWNFFFSPFVIPQFFVFFLLQLQSEQKSKGKPNEKTFGGTYRAAESMPKAYIPEVIILSCNGEKKEKKTEVARTVQGNMQKLGGAP